MGVHITFVRSTNLDSWNWAQLRTMKVGGNGAATEFFNSRRAGDLLRPGVEGKVKYTSPVASAYKEELERRAQADAASSGVPIDAPVYFPGLAVGAGLAVAPAPKQILEDDFFDDWDDNKPTASSVPATNKSSPPTTGLPGIGARRPQPQSQVASSPSPSTASAPAALRAAPQPSGTGSGLSTPGSTTPGDSRTSSPAPVSIPAARPPARRALGASRLGAVSAGSAAGRAGKLGGVKKAGQFDFAAAERKAAEAAQAQEEEKKRQVEAEVAAATEAQAAAQEAEQQAANQHAEETARQAVQAALNKQATRSPGTVGGRAGGPKTGAGASQDKLPGQVDRLGMGMGRLGLKAERLRLQQAAETSASRAVSNKTEEEMPDYARRKFGDQKAISSDMYFERGNYDSQANTEAQDRLQKFSGATAISSNAYFGRDEPDPDDPDAEFEDEWHSTDNGWSNGDFAELEATAKDYYNRFMSNPDVQSGLDSLRSGAMKLSQYLEDAARNGS